MSFSITACFISFVCSRSSWRRLRMDSSLAWILRSSASCWSLRRGFPTSLFLGERVHLFGCGRGGGLCGGRALLRGGHVGVCGLDFGVQLGDHGV